ncbi:hypothetical protein PMIN04_010446 [Paraphaeosphaeria minitans]
MDTYRASDGLTACRLHRRLARPDDNHCLSHRTRAVQCGRTHRADTSHLQQVSRALLLVHGFLCHWHLVLRIGVGRDLVPGDGASRSRALGVGCVAVSHRHQACFRSDANRFLIKFFQLLDPNKGVGYVAVVMIVVGWYTMVIGQSVVLWSRLHLITNSRRVIRYSLYMICVDVVILGFPTSVLTFGSNSNSLSTETLSRFVRGYNVMEKIQMVGFFLQELVLSLIYIKETLRILKLSKSTQGDLLSATADGSELKHPFARKVMYQLLAINTIIIAMDVALLAVEFANLYLVETTLKGVVYSVKLKLEFAVLGKLVQIVSSRSNSSKHRGGSAEGHTTAPTTDRQTMQTATSGSGHAFARAPCRDDATVRMQSFPDFVDPARVSCDVTHAPTSMGSPVRRPGEPSISEADKGRGWEVDGHHRKRRHRAAAGASWIDEEMDKHNIG